MHAYVYTHYTSGRVCPLLHDGLGVWRDDVTYSHNDVTGLSLHLHDILATSLGVIGCC